MTGLVLLIAVVAATLALGVWQLRRAQKRRDALLAFAVARGWDFSVSDDGLAERWVGSPFGEGEHRRVTNVVRGTTGGRDLLAFDYAYDTTTSGNHGDQRTTHRYAVVSLTVPGYLPTLQVTPESALQRAGGAVGVLDDIDLESEDFNRRFRVVAYDAKFASDVLTPETMQMLLSRPAFSWRLSGVDAVGWASGSLTPLDVVTRSSTLDAVLDGIPEFVWRDNGASAGQSGE